MTEEELKDMLKARDMLDAQPVPELSPERLHNIMEAMGFAPRPWVGLTGQEKALIASVSLDVHDAVHRTEAKLTEKNT